MKTLLIGFALFVLVIAAIFCAAYFVGICIGLAIRGAREVTR